MVDFNMGSILLGLVGWGIPVFNIISTKNTKRFILNAIISLSACATALLLQILVVESYVHAGDTGTLMDIIGGVSRVSTMLLITTIALNVFAYLVHRKRITS